MGLQELHKLYRLFLPKYFLCTWNCERRVTTRTPVGLSLYTACCALKLHPREVTDLDNSTSISGSFSWTIAIRLWHFPQRNALYLRLMLQVGVKKFLTWLTTPMKPNLNSKVKITFLQFKHGNNCAVKKSSAMAKEKLSSVCQMTSCEGDIITFIVINDPIQAKVKWTAIQQGYQNRLVAKSGQRGIIKCHIWHKMVL